MKKTFITALAAAVLAALLAATASAKTYVLDFTSEKSGNVTEAYTEENSEFRLSAGKSPKAAVSTLDGLEFQFRIDEAADWGLITVVTQSKYNETGLNGRGLKFRIGGEKGVEISLIKDGGDWNNKAINTRTLFDVENNTFDDGKYHTMSFSLVNGNWSAKIDGQESLLGITGEQYAEIASMISGEAFVCFGDNANGTFMTVKSAEVTENDPTPPDTGDAVIPAIIVTVTAAAVVIGKKRR